MDDVLSRPEPMFCENTHSLSGSFALAYYAWKTIEMSSQSGCNLWWKHFTSSSSRHRILFFDRKLLYMRPESSITRKKPLRIGFISSFFSSQSSIWGNFGLTIRYLQSFPRFQVDMIYYPRDDITENDKKLSLNPETNIYLSKFEPTPYSVKLHEARSVIASREFDILVYLDLYVVFECTCRSIA